MYINKAKKIVLKIGSSNLVDKQGKLREKWLKSLVTDIEKLRRKGKEFVIVSSGAIALGQNHLKVFLNFLKMCGYFGFLIVLSRLLGFGPGGTYRTLILGPPS